VKFDTRISWRTERRVRGSRWVLRKNAAKLGALRVNLMAQLAPQPLMEMDELEWSMEEFWQKAGDFAPTLVLIKMKNGTECGGVAGVPWPKRQDRKAADPAKGSFIFSLGATPVRFDLVQSEKALYCSNSRFMFGYDSDDLYVWSDGDGCGSKGQGDYAGPRGRGQLVGRTAKASVQQYERWELCHL
jgi:hypothetical protein